MKFKALPFILAAAVCFAAESEKALPEFKLTAVTSKSAKAVTKKDFKGKVWVANFMFTRCHGPCPLNSAKMASLQKKLPESVHLATFTVDPAYDQEKALKRYAKRFKADPKRWIFITAPDEETLIPLYKDGFGTAYRENKNAACGYETYHSTKFFLIGPDGTIKGQYESGNRDEMKKLEKDAMELASRPAPDR